MEMSRGHFVGAFVLFILMLSTTQAFPRNKEDSSKRNSVSDDSDFKELQCLFVDTKLPVCDPKWWSNSSGEFINNRTNSDSEPSIDQNRVLRKRSIVEIAPDTRIVVYAFKNCLFTEPDRLRFLMPFCEDVMRSDHYDKIVRVELFEPFVIEGLTEAPYLFPSRPKRPSSDTRHRVPAEKDQGHELTKTTSKETILNGIASSISSSSRRGPDSRAKLAETMDTEREIIATSSGRNDSRNPSSENTSRRMIVQDRRNSKSLGAESRNFGAKFSDEADRRQMIVIDRRKPSEEPSEGEEEDPLAILAIPKAPTTPSPSNVQKLSVGKLIVGNSANKMANRGDSNDLLLGPGPQRVQKSNGGDPNDPLTSPEMIAKNFRRTRETKTIEASSL
ncbi:uncharacterized protein LOC143211991 [Lasioglossum baleicum]|uniref:uncharacterized protein LOC143211991 n=1 Tax=Lasioglossum baleicum TaxID=434251 RepID=UPI003FCE67C7